MKLRVQRFPNNETRFALYPERFPKSFEQLCQEPLSVSLSPDSPPDRAFNIKSKVDTVPRKRHIALSRYGRRQVLRSGSCFDSSDRTERLLLTGTLPGTGNKAHKALAEYSSYASKTLTNWLTRRAPGCAWQYCWEYQKRGALHIHLVVEVPVEVSSYIQVHFKDEWNRILRKICSLSGTNLYAKTATYSHKNEKTQADVTICTKEPSRYISKYITKEGCHAKAFGRFPPKTWYQISRSLLKRLKNRTETYEIEGLSYRQSLCLIENFKSRIECYNLSGHRRFEGSVLSWHGYVYSDTFDIADWDNRLMKKNRNLISTQAMASRVREAVKLCHTTQIRLLGVTHHKTYELMEKRMLSETELLIYIETALRTLSATWKETRQPKTVSMALMSGLQWWESRFEYTLINPADQKTVLSECEDYLTTGTLGTKVAIETESPFQQLKLFRA